MPSIPQSLLWISLVVLWLFVLVPMLISKRDAVRRTSDVALATRVLNTGRGARLLKRGGPGGRAPQRSGLATVRGRSRRELRRGRSARRVDRNARCGARSRRRGRDRQRARLPRRRRRRRGLGRITCGRSRRMRRSRRRKRSRAGDSNRRAATGFRDRGERRHRGTSRTDEYEDRARRHRRRVRVRRRLLGPGGAGGQRSADGRSMMRRAATPVRLDEGRGGQRPQVQVPQADAGGAWRW